MNQIQIAIIGVVACIVLIIIGYYIYQENKFKKMIENNFNQATGDALNDIQGVVFENQDDGRRSSFETSHKDQELVQIETKLEQKEINFDPLLDTPHADNVPQNVIFNKFDQVEFPFVDQVSLSLDHVVDICFEGVAKIKVLPDIGQFTAKSATYYVLEKNLQWSLFERGKKYAAIGIRLVVDLVDSEGVMSELQLINIFNELANFALHHEGHIRQTDSELELRKIQQQLKQVSNSALELALYIVNKEPLEFRHLNKYLMSNGFRNNGGVFEYCLNDKVYFDIRDENAKPLNELGNYRTFSINSKLHHHADPMSAIDKIFDFAEKYMQYFESRLLTTNKLVMTDKDFAALEKQVVNYINSCKRQNIELGSELILRVLP
ncbi:MAG: hypothetical protein EKK54_04200 [Neisseriaceae bacterium]|nr:MAG: hypothetical protein EKK54_04200 [Neisseriaceae bacterium]